MDNELFEQRKRMIYDFICDELYVPMKLKELAILRCRCQSVTVPSLRA